MLPEPNEREFELPTPPVERETRRFNTPVSKQQDRKDAKPEMTNNMADPWPGSVKRKYGLQEHQKPDSCYPAHEYDCANSAGGETKVDPQASAEAMARENAELWRKAEEEEITFLLINKTWTSVQTLPEIMVKPVPIKWVYKINRNATGRIK
jgi:hypothetical protein